MSDTTLRDALAPFGARLSAYLDACDDGENLELFTARFDFAVHRVCVGDLRRARAALAAAPVAVPEGPWRAEPFKALTKYDKRAGWWTVKRGGQLVRPEQPYALLETEGEACAVRDALNRIAAERERPV